MSHIQHILALKEALEEKGLTNVNNQNDIVDEAFIRTLVASHACSLSADPTVFAEKAWKMLDKWNSVAPIPAQQYLQKFFFRTNQLNESLKTLGVPSTSHLNFFNPEGSEDQVHLEAVAEFGELVTYLRKEFKDGQE